MFFFCVTVKPGVLRYGPLPNESTHSGQSPIRPNVSMAQGGPSSATPESPHNSMFQGQQGLLLFDFEEEPVINQQFLSGIPLTKSQSFAKQKKNRKSPTPSGETFDTVSRDDTHSPAYSDISDDSTPVMDTEMTGEFLTLRF